MITIDETPADVAATTGVVSEKGWMHEISRDAWWAVASAGLAWTFEVYDLAVVFVILPVLLQIFDLTKAEGSLIISISAFGSIAGGIAFGYLADRYGRLKTLYSAVIIYSAFTGGIIFCQSLPELLVLRFLGGLGMGGAWAAGASLIAETWPPQHRGKGGAIMQSGLCFGSILAIALSALVTHLSGGLEGGAWKWLFVIGALPAILLYPMIRCTPESPIWLARTITSAGDREQRRTARALFDKSLFAAFSFIFCLQFVFWGVSTWIPTFLVTVKHMTFVRSTGFLFAQQLGTLAGFIMLALIIDRIGRRPTFLLYLLIGGVALGVLIFTMQQELLLLATALVGFGLGGIFGGLGPFLAEILKSSNARALGMAITYNGGRTGALIAPVVVGLLGSTERGFQMGMGLVGVVLMGAMAAVLLAPETKGTELE